MTEMMTGHQPSRRLVCKRMSDDAHMTTNASNLHCSRQTTSRGCVRVGSSMPQGLRGSIPGGVEMRAKGDDGGRGRGGRGTISSVLGGALSSLVELQERMVCIASSFATKVSDVNALGRTWRRQLRRRREVGGAGHAIPVPLPAVGRGRRGTGRRRRRC